MQSFVVCTASSTTLLLGKCNFLKISESFHIFLCNGVCNHYCKTQDLCQHVEWERDLLLFPAQPLDINAIWTRILTYFSQTFSLGVSIEISEANTDIKGHSKWIKILDFMGHVWKPSEISKKYDVNVKSDIGPAVKWADQHQCPSSVLSNILQVGMYVEMGGNIFFREKYTLLIVYRCTMV